MKSLWLLTKKSISNRKLTFALSLFSLSLSLCLLLLINRTQESARNSFTNTISKTDLIIGTRSSNIQILLYTLFHKGSPINNISYESYEKFSKKDVRVKWTIPISLGDSHRGHRVIGTSPDMFKHYRYQGDKSIEFTQGESFNDVGEVVIGSEVAKNLGYSLGNEILITHGTSESGPVHDHLKFKIVGILKKTFTPLDKAVFVSLESIEAIHLPKYKKGDKLEIKQLTSFLLKAKHRIQTLYIQREVVEYKKEPLMAVIPGVALTQLWEIVLRLKSFYKL
jgi:putative ABC transport system permease protein